MRREFWVTSLTYGLEPSETVKFNACPPVEFANQLGTFRLAGGELVVSLTPELFDSREPAKEAVQAVLRAWDVKTRLNDFHAGMNFLYRSSQVASKTPLPPGESVVFVEGISSVFAAGSVGLVVTRNSYPEPPLDISMSVDVETLWARYEQHVTGREPLQSMAYFISTYVEGCGDARSYFGASNGVRETLRSLASWKGNALTARKADFKAPLLPGEEEWIRVTVREVIRRAGQFAAGLAVTPLNLDDLPRLP
jgi:hypothetical protein